MAWVLQRKFSLQVRARQVLHISLGLVTLKAVRSAVKATGNALPFRFMKETLVGFTGGNQIDAWDDQISVGGAPFESRKHLTEEWQCVDSLFAFWKIGSPTE